MGSVSTWRACLLAAGAALAVPFGCYEDDPAPPDAAIDYEHRGRFRDAAAHDGMGPDTFAEAAAQPDATTDVVHDTPSADAPTDVLADHVSDAVVTEAGDDDGIPDAELADAPIDTAVPDAVSTDAVLDAVDVDAAVSDATVVDGAVRDGALDAIPAD